MARAAIMATYHKVRVVKHEDIVKCKRKAILASQWIPKHDCGDASCPMRDK